MNIVQGDSMCLRRERAHRKKAGLNVMSLLIFHHHETTIEGKQQICANKGFSTSHTLIMKRKKKKKAPKVFPRQRFTFFSLVQNKICGVLVRKLLS
jgi:hypothetical protein